MGTITGTALAANAASLIHDTDKVRWTDADWLTWLNDGLRDLVMISPEINAQVKSVALTADTTLQSLPADGVHLFDVLRNMGADGVTPGRAIRITTRSVLDATYPNWHNDVSTGYIQHYAYDPRTPRSFFVYPKAPTGTWYVEMSYSALPAAMTALSEAIPLDDLYANALLAYMLYRAYSRDIVYGDNPQIAQAYYRQVLMALGKVEMNESGLNPNLTTGPYAPGAEAAEGKPA